jgi:DUF4097 and DUF4098 domain-containing protein YvlB
MKTAIFLLAAVAAFHGTSAKAEEWHKRWSVNGKPELHVSAGDAAVEIEAGTSDNIDATVTTRGWSIGDDGVRIIEHQNGNRVDLDIKLPETHFSWGNRSLRVVVQVPHELMADVHTGDGSIKLRDLAGTVRADTGDGSIDANRLDGNLDVHTGDGSVHVSGRFDNLKLHTQDGSVDLNVLKGSRVTSDWRVQTGDGSVQVRLPRDLDANVEMHTGDGHISLGLPLTVTGVQTEHGIQGKLNSGGALVLVRTGDGSISMGAS